MSQRTLDFANWMLNIKNIYYHDLDAMDRAYGNIEAKEKNNKKQPSLLCDNCEEIGVVNIENIIYCKECEEYALREGYLNGKRGKNLK